MSAFLHSGPGIDRQSPFRLGIDRRIRRRPAISRTVSDIGITFLC